MKANLDRALKCLKEGKIIIYPTESCYSFGCDAKNEKAVRKIHQVKIETSNKPITLIVSDLDQVRKYGIVNETALKLYQNLMPGSINLVIEKNDPQKFLYLSKDGISFRVSTNKIACELSKQLEGAVTTTSVNIHGQPSLYDISEVIKRFEGKVCCIIDAGNLDERVSQSTIYNTLTNKIIRNGPIKEEQILHALK